MCFPKISLTLHEKQPIIFQNQKPKIQSRKKSEWHRHRSGLHRSRSGGHVPGGHRGYSVFYMPFKSTLRDNCALWNLERVSVSEARCLAVFEGSNFSGCIRKRGQRNQHLTVENIMYCIGLRKTSSEKLCFIENTY